MVATNRACLSSNQIPTTIIIGKYMSYGFNSPDNTIGWIGNGGAMIERLDSNDQPVSGAMYVG